MRRPLLMGGRCLEPQSGDIGPFLVHRKPYGFVWDCGDVISDLDVPRSCLGAARKDEIVQDAALGARGCASGRVLSCVDDLGLLLPYPAHLPQLHRREVPVPSDDEGNARRTHVFRQRA